jgi:hypothetical protein
MTNEENSKQVRGKLPEDFFEKEMSKLRDSRTPILQVSSERQPYGFGVLPPRARKQLQQNRG